MPSAPEQVDWRQLIPQVRQYVLKKCESEPDKYDQEDIDRVRTDQWTVLRFLKWNRGETDKSGEQLDACLRWRHEFGVNTRSEADLPQEFVKAGALFECGKDSLDRRLVFIRVKVYKKIPALVDYFRQFVVGVINKVDLESDQTGYALVFDLSGVGFSNADMDFLQFFITTIKSYFPYGVRHVIVYNLPRLLRPLWAVAKLWLGPQQRVITFVNGEEIKGLLPLDQLPRYLGGTAEHDFTVAPEGCKTVKELGPKYGFTDKEVEKYLKIFEPHIKEAQQLVRIAN